MAKPPTDYPPRVKPVPGWLYGLILFASGAVFMILGAWEIAAPCLVGTVVISAVRQIEMERREWECWYE